MKTILYLIIFGGAALCVGINLLAPRVIYHPQAAYAPHLMEIEEVSFPVGSGGELHGLYSPPAEFMDTILFFHGNAGNVTYFESFARAYTQHGYGFLVFDYRGFGRSKSRVSQRNIYADAMAAANYLIKTKNTAPANIILFGYSLGNAPAIETALKMEEAGFKALILQSPFTNTPQMGVALATGGYNPASRPGKIVEGVLHVALFNQRFDNLAKIGRLKLPILLGYSEQDSLIPWQMSEALAAAAPGGAKTYKSPRGNHHDYEWFVPPALEFLKGLDNR